MKELVAVGVFTGLLAGFASCSVVAAVMPVSAWVWSVSYTHLTLPTKRIV